MRRCIAKRHNALRWQRRLYSIVTPAASERVTVPCQGSGSLTLDIYHPNSAPPSSDGPAKVALYLPRGPVLGDAENDEANALTLRGELPCTLVKLNYRIGPQFAYPTPVYDVLAGYDWVCKHFLPTRTVGRSGRTIRTGDLAVFGELVGGGLAAMLGLTECRKGEAGVRAAAVSNPIVDWVFPESPHGPGYAKSTFAKYGDVHAGLSAANLSQARDRLFKMPDAAFDAFASPILFFRTAGVEPPRAAPSTVLDDIDQLSLLDRYDFFRQQNTLSGLSTPHSSSPTQEDTPIMTRKASRLYPSIAFNLRLPHFHVSASTTTPLDDQVKELSTVLRKSMIRQHRAQRPSRFGEKVLLAHEMDQQSEEQLAAKQNEEAEADEKVQYHVHQGLALWDQTPAGRRRLENAAVWVREKMF